jgi:hypothetical protein
MAERNGAFVPVPTEFLLRGLSFTNDPAVGFVSWAESVFRSGGGVGMCASAGLRADGDFQAGGIDGCEPAHVAPMAEMVERRICSKPILGFSSGPSEAAVGGRKSTSLATGLF